MNRSSSSSYLVDTPEQIPLHLRDRAPFVLTNTEAIFRIPENQVVGDAGLVTFAGAIEFQTQITPGVLTDICDPEELCKPELRGTHRFRCVYDPEIQRGIKETGGGPKEFLRPSEIEAMMSDIGEGKFECPQLMWNLRAGETVWVYVRGARELRLYEGVATRPDTNHRHHAIVNVHRRYLQFVRDTDSKDMPNYNPQRAYGLVIYTDSFSGEARRFFVYNFKGWRVSTSTAHYIESKTNAPNLYARLARELMERSGALGGKNVEFLSNHLSRNSAKMVTFGTLVDALKSAFPGLTEDEYEGVQAFMLKFLDALGRARPNEIGLLSVAQRQRARASSITDQAVLWHAYFRLASRLFSQGASPAESLALLSSPVSVNGYSGDPLGRDNPMWFGKGVIAQGKRGLRVVNNRQSRQGAFEVLAEITSVSASLPTADA